MGLQLPIQTTLSMMGIEDDLQRLKHSEISHHNVVHTDTDGATRSLHIQIIKQQNSSIRFKMDYLLHAGQIFNTQDCVIDVLFDNNMHIIHAKIGANIIPITQYRAIIKVIKDLRNRIGVQKEWTNFIKVFQKAKIDESIFNTLNWSGLSPSGEIQAVKMNHNDTISQPVFPALFLPGIIGCGPEAYSDEREKIHSLHVSDPITGDDTVMNYKYVRGKTPSDIKMSCTITHINDQEWVEYPLYELETVPDDKTLNSTKIKSFKIHHANSADGQMDKVDFKNQKTLAIALKSIRMLNRVLRGGEKAYKEEQEKTIENRRLYLPSDIWALTGLDKVMMPQTPAPIRGRFCFIPMGGQNTKRIFSDFDFHIGGNSYRYDYYKADAKSPDSLVVDMGVLFHDDFDISFTNLGRYFDHKTNKLIQPEHRVRAILLTHRHKDHISQLAHLVKHGYELPAIIIPPLAARQIKREMRELDIEKNTITQIESKFIILDHAHISKEASKNNPDTHNINSNTISVYWEHLEGGKLNQYEKFPVIALDDFIVRVGPMPHSDPGFMYEIITPAGSHLHTGDFKMDPTIQLYQPSFRTWLSHCKASSVSIDSTGATRDANERTPFEVDIQKSVVQLFKDNPENRFIIPILGSNTARFTTLIAAMGEVGKKYLIIDGKALEDLTDDLNKIHEIKKWAKREHNVEIAKKGSKKAAQIYVEEKDSDYVIAVTGTQLEPTSSLNRALSNWLPDGRYSIEPNDIIAPLQGPIPVGQNLKRRWAAQYFAEVFHQCRFLLPEMVEKECDLKLSGSGHASPIDIKELCSYLKNLKTVFPIHGGPEQLSANAKIAQEQGYNSIIAHNFDNYDIDKKGNVKKLKTETSEMVGIKSRLPDDLSFWLRRHFSTTVAPIRMHDDSPTGIALNQFERGLTQALGMPQRDLLKEAARFHISRTFNMSAQGGFLECSYKFGIEKLDAPIWDAKAIGVISGFDTETTGTDDRFDFIDQFSMTSYDLNRKRIHQFELKQKIPNYTIPNPEALLVTVTEFDEIGNKGIHPVLFADQIIDALHQTKSKSKELVKKRLPKTFKNNPSTRAKILLIAHNFPFDDRQLKALFKDTLSPSSRPHATDGVIGVDTLNIARSIHAIYPDKFKVRHYHDSDYLNFTLQALCEENGVSYDMSKAHNSALYDSERAIKLFWKMHDIAPKIVEQMVFNADASKGHLLNDMIGHDSGINGPHPVFCYLSKRRDRPTIRMGCFIGTIDGGSKAIIANLSHNPQDILSQSSTEIANCLSDKDDDQLEIIDLRQSPMIFPAKFFYKQNDQIHFPHEMFDRRARMVKEYLNFRDADLNMTNIHERLSKAWEEKKIPILLKYNIMSSREPDLHASPNQILKDAYNFKSSMRTNAGIASAKKTFNPIAQKTSKAIKKYRAALVNYLSATPDEQHYQLDDLNTAYMRATTEGNASEGQIFIVANLHYDIAPHAMPQSHVKMIEENRALHTKYTLERAVSVMDKLAKDPSFFEKMVGRSLKKRKIYNELKAKIAALSVTKNYDKNAAILAVTPWKLTA